MKLVSFQQSGTNENIGTPSVFQVAENFLIHKNAGGVVCPKPKSLGKVPKLLTWTHLLKVFEQLFPRLAIRAH